MSDESVAKIGRALAKALMARARTRADEDKKAVLDLQTQLCSEVAAEPPQPETKP